MVLLLQITRVCLAYFRNLWKLNQKEHFFVALKTEHLDTNDTYRQKFIWNNIKTENAGTYVCITHTRNNDSSIKLLFYVKVHGEEPFHKF